MFGRGFESRRLHFITYHKKLKACKTLSLQAFLFLAYLKMFIHAQNFSELIVSSRLENYLLTFST